MATAHILKFERNGSATGALRSPFAHLMRRPPLSAREILHRRVMLEHLIAVRTAGRLAPARRWIQSTK